MSETRWRELADGVTELPLDFRMKWVDVAEPKAVPYFKMSAAGFFDSSFGPFLILSIEWLDIAPKACADSSGTGFVWPDTVEAHLRTIGVSFHHVEGAIRVLGHIRRGFPE